jgi:hypothetical protein
VQRSEECVINLPTTALADQVVGMGNTSGAEIDKFVTFALTPPKAHVAPAPRHPRTLHYTGDGVFMVAGKIIGRRSQFRPELLED